MGGLSATPGRYCEMQHRPGWALSQNGGALVAIVADTVAFVASSMAAQAASEMAAGFTGAGAAGAAGAPGAAGAAPFVKCSATPFDGGA